MAQAIEKMPELKKIAGNVKKHVELSCEITNTVESK